jgi:hypothetical protein
LGFELGAAVNEHNVMMNFEQYMYDGMALSEWRSSGLPKAQQERLRQGARTRRTVQEALKQLYAKDQEYVRNDSALRGLF